FPSLSFARWVRVEQNSNTRNVAPPEKAWQDLSFCPQAGVRAARPARSGQLEEDQPGPAAGEGVEGLQVQAPRDHPDHAIRPPVEAPVREVGDVAGRHPALPDADGTPV